jgi:hypothetical protein
MPSAVSLPPRNSLPRDVEIPVLPGLGITWYDRGGRYWVRRVFLMLMWALALLLIAVIDVGFFSAVRHSSRAAFAVLLVIDVALAVAAVVYAIIRTVQRWNTPSLPRQARTVFRVGHGRSGAVLSNFLQLGYLLAILACAFAFLLFPGLIVAFFLVSLLPQPLAERQARLWMAERLRERGILPAG